MKLIKEKDKILVNHYVDNYKKPYDDIYHVMEGNKRLGVIGLHNTEHAGVYFDIFIFKDYRNNNNGTKAINLLIEELKKNNLHKLIVLTNTKEYEKFLLNCGFKENTEYIYNGFYYSIDLK